LRAAGAEVLAAGFISDPHDSASAADRLRSWGCDLVVVNLPTYLTASMVIPIAQCVPAPLLLLNLQPSAAMDHATFDTERWLEYCGACPLPEVSNALSRCGFEHRSVSGYIEQDEAWRRVLRWVRAAGIRASLRTARHGLMGHLYPGMLDVSTDPMMLTAAFGGHIEVLELDDLRVRVDAVTEAEAAALQVEIREIFEVADDVPREDLQWATRVAAGMRRLVADFSLDSLAYYHRGLDGELHERLGAGMILGASLLSGEGIATCGEFDLRTSVAMMIMDRFGAGGSFTEIQALNFTDGVVEMGHDGPGHIGVARRRPVLRGLGVYHGKRGWGVSVQFDVRHGSVTLLGLGQRPGGELAFVTSAGEVVDGPVLQIGNTSSRVAFGCSPGLWTDAWSASGVSHHWALGTGDRRDDVRVLAELAGIAHVAVDPRIEPPL
jgi:L-arabinose isomerase